jgi:hypothetical protein
MVAMKLFDSERRVTEAAELLARPPTRYSARKVKCATSRYLSRDDGRPPGRYRHHRHDSAPGPARKQAPSPPP